MTAARCISMLFNKREVASKSINERLLLKEKNVQDMVLLYVEDCVTASRNISVFFNERAAASEKIFNDCF